MNAKSWAIASITIIAAGLGFDGAFAEAPAPVPAVRAATTTYVVGRDTGIEIRAQRLPAACSGQPVHATLFLRDGAEPYIVSAFAGSAIASGSVAADGSADVQLALPESLSGPVRVWPGMSGACIGQPVVDDSLGVELAVLDQKANPGTSSSVAVSNAGLASIPNRPDGLPIGALVGSVTAFANGKLCASVPTDPKVTGGATVVLKLGAPGQPSDCSLAGARITFTTADGKEFLTKMTLIPGTTRLLDNFAAGSPPTTSGVGDQPAPPAAGIAQAQSTESGTSWREPLGIVLVLVSGVVAIAAARRRPRVHR